MRRILAVTVACAVLAGCAGTHGLLPAASPRGADSLAAKETLAGLQVSAASWPREDWWKSFGDPQLDRLMDEALAGSPTLAVAAARARKALAAVDAQHAATSPHASGGASVTRATLPESLLPAPFGGSWGTFTDLHATLGWEADLWGKNRAAYESVLGAARAAEVDTHAARLALSSGVAQAYVQLQHAFLQLDVALASLQDRERILSLTQERHNAGLDSNVEVKQAETSVPATRVRVTQLHERIALTRNQLAALLGAGPDRGLSIARPTATTLAPVAIPSTLPAELLGRRPDLVAQRWRIEAARQDIAVARARFYPEVDLLALVGLEGMGGSNLLTTANRLAAVRAGVTLPILDGPRLRASLAATDADYDIAVEQYNQSLADAMREVVDQLASLRSLEEQRGQQAVALATSRQAYELALQRYRAGLGNYLQVLSAEQPLIDQQSLEVDLRTRGLELSINLIRALGGGVL
jgi:NodT family efflux transporter outer membrane factor (OMF) lipoprotein